MPAQKAPHPVVSPGGRRYVRLSVTYPVFCDLPCPCDLLCLAAAANQHSLVACRPQECVSRSGGWPSGQVPEGRGGRSRPGLSLRVCTRHGFP